jgi:uncharacterized protein YbcI
MNKSESTMAQQVAQAVMAFQKKTTGHTSRGATVVLSENTLVITLHDALSPAEKEMAKSPEGAAKVQEYHRKLFANSSQSLREDIRRITGVEVREAVAEVEATTGTVVCAFASGTVVQVFQLAQGILATDWDRTVSADPPWAKDSIQNEPKETGAK